MADRCLLRIRPPDFQDILPSLDEYSAWEPCADPVMFAVREPYAPGGWLLLCAKHSKGFERFSRKSEAQE